MNNATDLIAKLLANEDISVIQANVPTASFNIKDRVLTLPIWKDASQDLIGMLVGHEVGHALYTTDEYTKNEFVGTEYSAPFQGYLNILEDVRIEKLMKRKYPGIRKTFAQGYKELNDKDFFEVKSRDFDDMLLIDKINLYFKVGYDCGVSFTKEEKTFVERAERTETIEEVIQLAREIFSYTKEELEDAMEKAEAEIKAHGIPEVEEDDDSDGDEEETQMYADSNKGLDTLEEALEAKTETSYQKRVQELADVNTIYKYFKPGKFLYNAIMTPKEIMAYANDKIEKINRYAPERVELTPERLNKVAKFKANSTPVVSYLIKEFEMKKAATAYKRTTIAKTGQLDMRKIYAYTLHDDLFKRMSVVKSGKNHGMIFLLDWSGSMSNCIDQTVDQVINLAMFCRSAQIPFQVLSFTDNMKKPEQVNLTPEMIHANAPNTLEVNSSSMTLLEFFNHKMSTSEFNNMVTFMKTNAKYVFPLNGTPLNSALNYMVEHVGKFKKQYNVEKLTFITLTDGQGETLQPTSDYLTSADRSDGVTKDVKNFLVDDVTGKTYPIDRYHSELFTRAFLSIIKDRYDVTTLGFFLSRSGWRDLQMVLTYHYMHPTNTSLTVDRMKKEMKERGYASLKGTGRDELFVVPLQAKIEDGSIEDIKASGSSASIARQFGKILNKRKTSRVLLSKFIDYVA